MADKPISVLEAAHQLGVTRGQVAKYLRRKAIKGAFRIGKAWAIPVHITILMLPGSRPPRKRLS